VSPGGPTIFIVDDDDAVRQSLRALLEAYEYTVEEYRSGSSFLAGYENSPPGCVILDMHLPEMNGLEILTRFRGDKHSAMPVVMITGRGDKSTRERMIAAGANSLLDKPLDSDKLVATIQALIAN
jgi:FixJ family two-component response regulator